MPTFEFREWLIGLTIANVVLLALTPFAFRGTRWIRPLAYLFAAVMLLNGAAHTTGTILGRTVESVRFTRPMAGFYSSPALLAASTYLWIRLRKPIKRRFLIAQFSIGDQGSDVGDVLFHGAVAVEKFGNLADGLVNFAAAPA